MGVISNLKKLNFADLLYQVADPPTFYTKSRMSQKSEKSEKFQKSEKSEKFQEVMVRRPSSFSSESSITTNPLAHAGENPLSYQAFP